MRDPKPLGQDLLLKELSRLPYAAERALEKWGQSLQKSKWREETAELALCLAHHEQAIDGRRVERDPHWEDILDEVADVLITTMQIGLIHGNQADLSEAISRKLEKLEKALRGTT